MLTVCFAGLPSAGKSTMINALAGKRVLESGICRTTTEPCVVGSANTVGAQKWVPTKLESDDGVEFCAVDLPGICDAEDATGSFDGVTREWAAKCDVVVWVTDARTAFLTTHEAREYAALRAATQEKADEDGTLYQFCIVLAKYDASGGVSAPSNGTFIEGEIRTHTEDTTIDGNYERVVRAFPETRVAKFSAFARIVSSGSEALRALVSSSSSGSSGANAAFELKWATDGLVERRFAQMSRVLRATRNRAVSAERRAALEGTAMSVVKSRLDEADARADAMMCALNRIEQVEERIMKVDACIGTLAQSVPKSPYDTYVTLEFAEGTAVEGGPSPYTGYQEFTISRSLPSVRVAIDRACSEAWLQLFEMSMWNHTLRFQRSTGPVPRWSRGVHYTPSYFSIQLRVDCSFGVDQVRQIAAPVVKPAYGDVYIDPARVRAYGGNLSYECGALCLYTGTPGTGDQYVLKVGEAVRADLIALVRAITAPRDLITNPGEHSPLRLVAVNPRRTEKKGD